MKVNYRIEYLWNNSETAGFSFPCNKNGNVKLNKMNPFAKENYRKCTDGTYDVEYMGVVKYKGQYRCYQ